MYTTIDWTFSLLLIIFLVSLFSLFLKKKNVEKIKILLSFYDERCYINIPSNATVFDIKTQLSQKFFINVSHINLRSEDILLKDDDQINKYQIKEDSRLIMTETITVIIKYFDATTPFATSSDATISSLRERISEVTGMEKLNDYGLIFQGKDLENHQKFYNYKIKNNSEIIIDPKINIIIKSCRKSYNIVESSNATVEDVRRKLSEIIHIERKYIKLRKDSIYLLDEKGLTKYEIENNSELFMSIIMRINVNYCGESHEIEESSEKTIENIKTQLSMEIGIGIGSIQLYMNEEEVKNETLLGQMETEENKFELRMRVKITVIIEFCEEEYRIGIFSDETISDLKKEIRETFKNDINEIILHFNDQILNDDKMINEYKIKDKSRLAMKTNIKLLIDFCEERENIEVYSDTTFEDIKGQLRRKFGIEESHIILSLNEECVDNGNEKIYKYKIRNNAIIKMREKVKINIKCHDQNYNFELFSDEKVSNLILELSKSAKMERNSFQLWSDKIHLQTEEHLYKYKLGKSEIIMIEKMKINVKYEEKEYSLEYFPNAKVEKVKRKLSQKFKIGSKKVYLEISGKEMVDEEEIGIYGKDSLSVSMSKMVNLVCYCLERNYQIAIPVHFTVDRLKLLIKNKAEIKGALQLSFNGSDLEDDKTIQESGITDNSLITVLSTLKGG